MSDGKNYEVHVTGDVSGQFAVGEHIEQRQDIRTAAPVTEAELDELRRAFAELRARVAAEAPPERRELALEQVSELEEAVTAEQPRVQDIAHVKGWFARKLPGLAGAVAGVVVHPIVGRLVEAAGDKIADEFRKLIGADAERGG